MKNLSTKDFYEFLCQQSKNIGVQVLKSNSLDLELLIKLIGNSKKLNIVKSSDGYLSEVKHENINVTDRSKQTTNFSLHTDGAYYSLPPYGIVLACYDPGLGDAPTYFSDTTAAINKLSEQNLKTLLALNYTYIAKDSTFYTRPLIEKHPFNNNLITNLTSRGFLSPVVNPNNLQEIPEVFDYSQAFEMLRVAISDSLVLEHYWEKGDILVFDNYTYLHGRRGNEKPDYSRHLSRLWFNVKVS